jgi:hypothetical protein
MDSPRLTRIGILLTAAVSLLGSRCSVAYAQVTKNVRTNATGELVDPTAVTFPIAPGVTSTAKTNAGIAKQVWLAVRTDGRAGTGTQLDPYDASTAAKLDVLFPTFTAGTAIYFGEGTFETTGVTSTSGTITGTTGLISRSGQKLIGSGQSRTTIKFKAGTLPTGTYTADTGRRDLIVCSDDVLGVEISDLTVDANRANQSAYGSASSNTQIYYINITGASSVVRNVTVRGGWNYHPSAEAFPIALSSVLGTTTSPTRGVIENVTWEEYPGYCTALSLLAPSTARVSGRISNNIVLGRKSGAFSATIGAGCGGWQGVEISGNIFDGVNIGINCDTHNYDGVIVRNNYIYARVDPSGSAGFGVFLGGGDTYKKWFIHNNRVLVSRNVQVFRVNGNCEDITVADNEVLFDGSSGGTAGRLFSVVGSTNARLHVRGNRMPTTGALGTIDYSSGATSAQLVTSTNNRYVDGTNTDIVDDYVRLGRATQLWDEINSQAILTVGDQELTVATGTTVNFTDVGSKLLVTESGVLTPLTVSASKSVRRNAGNTAFEEYTPATVTSVAMTLPSILAVTGSPVTTTGTFAVTLATQTKNTFLAGPVSGSDAAPTFRAIDVSNNEDVIGTANSFVYINSSGKMMTLVTPGAGAYRAFRFNSTTPELYFPAAINEANSFTSVNAFVMSGGSAGNDFRVTVNASGNYAMRAYGTSGSVPYLGFFNTTPIVQPTGDIRAALDALGLTTAAAYILVEGTPASAAATGVKGTIQYDSSYIYICTATNTWKRVAIATW